MRRRRIKRIGGQINIGLKTIGILDALDDYVIRGKVNAVGGIAVGDLGRRNVVGA